jgi:2-polyprenyl-3-methyl-5-hydroxy-6-metoxy-1,4-benzoquinol methylase
MAHKFRWQVAQAAERKWWQNYLKNKDVPTYLDWKKKYWIDLLKTCEINLADLQNKSVLDAGCGPAGIFIALKDSIVTAFDPLLDAYKEDLPVFNTVKYPHATFITSSIESFTRNQKFDYIFCMNAINHVADIAKSYEILCSMLQPNGIIVVSIDAHNYNFFKTIFKAIPGDILHPHQYNLKEYESFLTQSNCEMVTTVELKKELFFNHYVQVAKNVVK